MRKETSSPLDRERIFAGFRARDISPACFAFAISFSVFLYSLAPGITFGDSGELITAAYTLGIAHPPGYPLWLLFAKLFSFIPLGDIAYRLNLMSALLDAVAIGILSLVISRTLPAVCARVIPGDAFDSPVVGMVIGSASASATLILAFSSTFWHQSVIAEVYALNNLLVCSILLILVLWAEKPEKNGLLFVVAFLFGAGQANHQTLLLMGPAIVFFVLLLRPRFVLAPKAVLGCLALFLLGLCFYFYLPIRASALPPINWGDPSTWENFWFHFARKQFRTIEVVRPLSVIMPQIRFFFTSIAAEPLQPILLVPALLTLGFASRKGGHWIAFSLAAFICTGIVFSIIANTELDLSAQDIHIIYFLPAYIVVAVWLGYGIGIIGLLALRASRRLRLEIVPATVVAILWLLLPISNLAKNVDTAGMRNHDFGRLYGEMLMNGLKPGSLLLTGTDSAYAIPMYMKWVEGHRTDVSILTITRLSDQKYLAEALRNAPNMALPGRKDFEEAVSTLAPGAVKDGGISGWHHLTRINAFFAWKIRQRNDMPIYLDEGVPIESLRYFAIPSGLVAEILPSPVESIPPRLVEEDTEYWDGLEKTLLVANPVFAGDIEARQKFSKCRSNIGALYLHHEMYPQAKAALDQAIRFSDRNMEAYAYLALLHKKQGSPEEAVRIFGEYMRRDPWNTSARGFYNSLKQ
jgi:hypothetical protein